MYIRVSYVVRVLYTVINIFKFIFIIHWVDGHFFHFHTHGVEIRGRGGNSGKKGMADASGDGD